MNEHIHELILRVTGATAISGDQSVQSLWSGYGEIRRYHLVGSPQASVMVKQIQWGRQQEHPRGWNTDRSHQRKLTSYQVEKNWYLQWSVHAGEACRVPAAYAVEENSLGILLVLEDLNAAGYDRRRDPQNVSLSEVKSCLRWLAHFHGTYMGASGEGLWPVGTYWHLDTRPDEWVRMTNPSLKQAAVAIDRYLRLGTYQTLVHGDAKLANFCFDDGAEVAAVDFQYVGIGCAMKDVAYLIGSALDAADCGQYEGELLNHYFKELEMSLDKVIDFKAVKSEYLKRYPYAWADFYRFLDGWSPGHWKMHDYSREMVNQVLEELNNQAVS